ncbi:unnamed protein product [Coregonus sp. 'balchen']|nr:unnamed protein product [Coregonus sp. 'balchen']
MPTFLAKHDMRMSYKEGQLSGRRAAMHSQLDGVRSGLNQLHNALGDVKDLQNSPVDVSNDWKQSINTIENPKDCLRWWHTPLMMAQADQLERLHKLMNLECSYTSSTHVGSKNEHGKILIRKHFGAGSVSDNLGQAAKQCVLESELFRVLFKRLRLLSDGASLAGLAQGRRDDVHRHGSCDLHRLTARPQGWVDLNKVHH